MNFPYKLVDLTHTLHCDIPTWDGLPGFIQEVCIDYADCAGEDKFRVFKMTMNGGIGTHMDAPSHCIFGGRCIHDFTLDELCMPVVVIDVSEKCHEQYSVTVDDILDFENKVGPIPKNACVMIRTGWSRFWDTPLQYHNQYTFPSVSLEAAKFLLGKEVSALGIDTLSPDRISEGFPVHQIFLGAGKILIENVAHLDRMPRVGGFVLVLPIKIKEGTEAPIRLVGLISSTII